MLALLQFLLNENLHGHLRHLLVGRFNLLDCLFELFYVLQLLVNLNMIVDLTQIIGDRTCIQNGVFGSRA